MEKQEKKGFKDLASVLSLLPKPAQGSVRPISVADAIEAGFFPAVDEDQANMFTPSELRLYRHAQDHRLARDIPGYPKLFCDIPGYTGIRYDIPLYLRWTVDELKDMIALLKRADFDPTDIDTDLHKRVADAIQDGFIRRFDMRVNSV